MTSADTQDSALEAAVWDVLQPVMDPELGFSLVDLGLIQSVSVSSGHAVIELALTTPVCPLAGWLQDAVHEAVAGVPGIREVTVRLVNLPWPPRNAAPWRRWLDDASSMS